MLVSAKYSQHTVHCCGVTLATGVFVRVAVLLPVTVFVGVLVRVKVEVGVNVGA